MCIRDRVYVLGGYVNFGQVLSSVTSYDRTTDTWRSLLDLPEARYKSGAASPGGAIYLFGGCDTSGQTTKTTFIYWP